MGFHSKSFRFEGWRETEYIGLKRTGKSCRLRWVNYLHPSLKREKLTPDEERLVVELQSKWGNRWSRIARNLPGRTDNEIKNYWRTHMRKTKKNKGSSSPSSSSSSASSSKSSAPTKETSFFDTGGVDQSSVGDKTGLEVEEGSKAYTMDEIWKEFEFSEENRRLTSQTVASSVWDDYSTTDSLWCINTEEESKMLMQQPMGDYHFPFCNYMIG